MLGDRAIAYVLDSLSGWGAKTLSRHLARRTDLPLGTVITFLPEDVSEEEANELTVGGKLPDPPPEYHVSDGKGVAVPVPNTDVYLIEQIRVFFAATSGNPVCVFEDAQAEALDPCVAKFRQAATLASEVYHVLTATDDDAAMDRSISETRSAGSPLIGAMTSLAESSLPLLHSGSISPELMQELAARTAKIIVGAYDGESYLIWNAPRLI